MYVASRTLVDPLPWQNSTLLQGEAVESAARLRRDLDGDVAVLGSGVLVRSPAAAGLVDSVATTTGVIIATYRPH